MKTELQELTDGKSIFQLEKELEFQIRQGEKLGGTICSHIIYEIERLTDEV